MGLKEVEVGIREGEGVVEGAGKEMLCDKWPALLPEP